jgi:hypothetical protein
MMKLPAREDGRWTVQHANNKVPDIIANRNLVFDKEGYIRLSKPTVSFLSDADDADFGVPILYNSPGAGIFDVCTDEGIFNLDMRNESLSYCGGYMNCVQTSSTGAPVNSSSHKEKAGAIIFDDDIWYFTYEDLYTRSTGGWANTWTDRGISASIGTSVHAACSFLSTVNVAVTDGSEVEQVTGAFGVTTPKLTIPTGIEARGLAWNNGYIGITTHDTANAGNGAFFVWDGKTTSANYSYYIGASTCVSPTPYKGSFLFINGTGQLMYWTPQGLEEVAAFPCYYTDSLMFLGEQNVNKSCSSTTMGTLALFNVDSTLTGRTNRGELFLAEQPAGIWCYDENVGLYHRHATTATKIVVDVIPTTDVNTTTDRITVTTGYETGTPVRYSNADGTTLAGLTDDGLYYTIKIDATTIKLATSYNNAIAGTAVDLTGTGGSNQTLQFYLKTDFGQSYASGAQGVVSVDETGRGSTVGIYYQDIFYGANVAKTGTTEYDCGGFVLKDTENRGYFITSKFQSRQLQDDWQKLYIKHSSLVTGLDKIVIKYRTGVNEEPIVRVTDLSGTITWTDSNTFTTTDTQWANVLAGDEVEVVQGTGAGYLAHVSSITESTGTYTVNIDEDIKNLTASDTGRAVVSRWTKLGTLDATTPQNNDGYSELLIAQRSKSIQFKVELRGEDIEIEELLVAHTPIKLAI